MRSFESVKLNSIELFCKAAELGSFSAAAEQLGLTPASVSRSIARMEERLGVRLFTRSTRNVRLTSEGNCYWQECQRALEQIAEAERAITGNQKIPSGVLRITVGTLYANYRLLPLLPSFQAAYPQIELEVSLSSRNVDFADEGFDLAIRLGEPPDSRLVAHKLEDASVGVFAAPAYLAQHGEPKILAELQQHDCLEFILPSTGKPMPWLFKDAQGKAIEQLIRGRMRVLDDAQGCISWGRAGGGIFQTYHFIANDMLQKGELVEILQPYAGRCREFHILYPQNRHLSARVRRFVDFMTNQCRHDQQH